MLVTRFATLCAVLLFTACVLAPPTNSEAARCLDLYNALDQAVARYGVTPSAPVRVQGFPYLRVDRFLASYRDQPLEPAARKAWLGRLAGRDLAARQVELESLPKSVLVDLAARHGGQGALSTNLAACSQILQAHDLATPARLELLSARAVTPADYHTLNQVLGLYPLTALPVSYGAYRWREETRQVFTLPLEAVPVAGRLQRWQPPAEALTLPRFTSLSQDELGVPLVEPAQLAALFAAHAPVWEIDVAGDFDRPGTPRWGGDGLPTVDPDNPVVYRYTSYSRWQGRILLQLNYVIWFAERPRTGPLDILGGALDGLIWRVTLDERGEPLVYDSIHTCGCYHLLFPTSALRLRPAALQWPEPPLLAQAAPRLANGERVIVRINSGSHYLQRVYADAPWGSSYAWRDYQALYAVSTAAGTTRSLFGPDGLVPGTERGERWLLWPMGIASPGAMRERGRHATAFVGRRHFDDAELLEQVFEPVEARP